MKKSILIISALLMVSVCWGKNTQAPSTNAVVTDPSDVKKEIVTLIHELYSTIAKKEDVSIDERFACHAWRNMVAAVNEKDKEVEEIGFFNDDYWTMMQDGIPDDLEARDIEFEQLDVEKGTAMVSYILYSSVQTIHQKFAFCREDGEWRVHDIIRFYTNADGQEEANSLMEAMQNYLNEE